MAWRFGSNSIDINMNSKTATLVGSCHFALGLIVALIKVSTQLVQLVVRRWLYTLHQYSYCYFLLVGRLSKFSKNLFDLECFFNRL